MSVALSTAIYSASRLPSRASVPLRNFGNLFSGLKITDLTTPGHEKVVQVEHLSSRLNLVIGIHSTKLGPSFGPLSAVCYRDFDAALTYVNRVSRERSLSSALAGAGLGGGKSVMIADPKDVTPEMLKACAVALNMLKGSYIASKGDGISMKMLDCIGQNTRYVTGLGLTKSSGDSAPSIAWGVFRAMQATCEELDGVSSLKGKVVAVNGLDCVGAKLVEFLFWAGAAPLVADRDPRRVSEVVNKFGAIPYTPGNIEKQKCDIFSPCAFGRSLNPKTISALQCRAIVGAADDQLSSDSDADELQARGILYVPGILAGSGEARVVGIGGELVADGHDPRGAREAVDKIYDMTKEVFAEAKQSGNTPHKIATTLANNRIQQGSGRRIGFPVFHHFLDTQFGGNLI